MRVTIFADDVQSLKTYLQRSVPDCKASHRIEAVARGLGYNTYAGLREALNKGPLEVVADDSRFCAYLGIPFVVEEHEYNRFLSRALARIELHRVLAAQPNLTLRGFDNVWIPVSGERELPLAERKALLAKRRNEAHESHWSFDEFELAWIYLSRQLKIKNLNRSTSSYGLKHRAENLMRKFGLFQPLGNYVSNGMLIAAAYSLGFDVKPIGHDSYNAYLNISTRTVNQSEGRNPRSWQESPSIVEAMYGDLNRLAA